MYGYTTFFIFKRPFPSPPSLYSLPLLYTLILCRIINPSSSFLLYAFLLFSSFIPFFYSLRLLPSFTPSVYSLFLLPPFTSFFYSLLLLPPFTSSFYTLLYSLLLLLLPSYTTSSFSLHLLPPSTSYPVIVSYFFSSKIIFYDLHMIYV